jgi:Uma2 family endonuclease
MVILAKPVTAVDVLTLTLRLDPAVRLSDDQLLEICRLNRDLRIERTSQGDLVMMAPAGGGSGERNAEIVYQLRKWAKEDGTGVAFDSSAGFILPNRAMRAPDAAWVRRSRLTGLTRQEKEKFLPLCPDFVVELRSVSDRLEDQREKVREYIENGASLGWLIDPIAKKVHVYRPGQAPEILREPRFIAADSVLPGFQLQLGEIWEPSW